MGFKLPELNFSYDALEPSIDARTMEIHHSKHHNGYTNNLNNAIQGTSLDSSTIESILVDLDMDNKGLRNNAGGYYNHNLFFENLAPKSDLKPSDTLNIAFQRDFGTFESFKQKFISTASNHIGSGWTWLILNKDGKLEIIQTNNQDNPLMKDALIKGKPLLNIDTWEHAYYLQYQNRKLDYIRKVFELLNWDLISKKYDALILK